MKGVTREKVSLTIGNYLFRKRRVAADGGVFFSCNGCETQASKYLSAIAKIKEDGSYELIEWPRSLLLGRWVPSTSSKGQKSDDF